jgi:hypothetical protein
MSPALHSHTLALSIDDETWEALERMAEARGESLDELVVYAVEQFLERAGFVPEWARIPLEARLAAPSRARPRGKALRRTPR